MKINKPMKAEDEVFPEPPTITETEWVEARKTGNYAGIAFEEYKFVAQLAALVSGITKDSEHFRDVPSQHYKVLAGLMNRCARLMLGTLHLSHNGKFGETSSIISRCIIETGTKIMWLCKDTSQDKFDLYVNDGLKTEIELKTKIEEQMKKNGGVATAMEKRMLDSIEYHIKTAETSESAIITSKKMPNMDKLMEEVNFGRIMYLTNHKMGSHHIHGTWPSLIFHYLEKIDGELIPRGNDVTTGANEFLMTSLIVTKAMYGYCNYLLTSTSSEVLKNLSKAQEEEILNIFDDMTKSGW